jgi:hypothetical protein
MRMLCEVPRGAGRSLRIDLHLYEKIGFTAWSSSIRAHATGSWVAVAADRSYNVPTSSSPVVHPRSAGTEGRPGSPQAKNTPQKYSTKVIATRNVCRIYTGGHRPNTPRQRIAARILRDLPSEARPDCNRAEGPAWASRLSASIGSVIYWKHKSRRHHGVVLHTFAGPLVDGETQRREGETLGRIKESVLPVCCSADPRLPVRSFLACETPGERSQSSRDRIMLANSRVFIGFSTN